MVDVGVDRLALGPEDNVANIVGIHDAAGAEQYDNADGGQRPTSQNSSAPGWPRQVWRRMGWTWDSIDHVGVVSLTRLHSGVDANLRYP